MPLHDLRVIGLSPFECTDASLVVALCRAGALGVLDLGRDMAAADAALTAICRQLSSFSTFGVRVPDGVVFDPALLPASIDTVVLSSAEALTCWRPRKVIVQVCSIDEARRACEAGADGLIAKGAESGGRIGDDSAYVLLQRLAGAFAVPIWVQGGIGLHTAAACIAGGARGVVLDSQLALVAESTLPADVKAVVSALDGSETAVVGGRRLVSRPDLGGRALPAGQDAAFALPLAQRYRTAGGIVRAVKRAMEEQLRMARRLRPLAPGSPFASEHRIEFPIAQGPMTRVSDRAAFADAVSRAGALPFLALSLMRGPDVRTLLDETAARLQGRAWGVGILGFVPPELAGEQLRVIEEVRPPVALIAGGRPAQARSLEAAGIATYLHVPSPGLLDLFLKDGARRFVFEGRECGGHVGPRTSFTLWESQVERLMHFDAPAELSVLFAGGIHDERSAAMVAALTAPLAARGARIGVLMGTAYLFSREAVETGAIGQAFQDAALTCDRTVLLETGPGHATRCVDNEYTRFFAGERGRLDTLQLAPQERWAALEQLNLGRLRVAAKGLRRTGDALVPVDVETQRRDGMFMIGQIAALRTGTTTVRELHERVSAGATDSLAGLRAPGDEETKAARDDIAIIGMACVFPGAPDLDAYWSNIVNGADLVTEVPRARWDPDIYFDPGRSAPGKTNSKWGAFIPPVEFDPAAHGIPPRSVSAIEPVQLLSLEVASRALADAGYAQRDFDRERAAVIFGVEPGTDLANMYGFRALYPQYVGELPKALDESLPPPTEDSFPGVLGNVVAGRIANRLDLGGVNYTVDAACASSLAALDAAIKELTAGDTDMVLCGGADLHNSINDYLMFSAVRALSPSGRCRPFDAEADGLALGEGVAVVVLKRLKDAERAGDRIYAVVRGVGSSSDGRCLSLTAPRPEGQQRALDSAYRRAGVSPADIGLLEAHGTGTVVGDHTELSSLTAIFDAAGAAPGSCTLGSVKSQIGHTKCAAGMAGLIKVALSLHHGVLPPTLHVKRPNPFHRADSSPFVFSDVARPWSAGDRHGAVSAFGFGGTNFHAVLSGHTGTGVRDGRLADWPAELFLFRGPDRDTALGLIARLGDALSGAEDWRLKDLACSVSTGGSGPVQFAIVASDVNDLRSKLRAAATGADDDRSIIADSGVRGRIAFLFPGQGSQRPGMLADLFVAFPSTHAILRLGRRWHDRMFPPKAFTTAARARAIEALGDTRVAQPCLGLAGLAAFQTLDELGIRPDMVAGHSYGELVALAAAGTIAPADLLNVSEARGEAILGATGADPGTMAAVSGSADVVARLLADVPHVVIANYNAPDQTVIAGPTGAVDAVVARCREGGLSAQRLPVACAFHSPVVAAAERTFARRLEDVALNSPTVPVWSNVDAEAYPPDTQCIRERLALHLARPVEFVRQIEAMYEAGARLFVEAGPGSVLTTLVGRILGARPHVAVACDRPGEHGLVQLQRALGVLAVHGAPVDAAALFQGRHARTVDPTTPRATRGGLEWMVNGQAAWPRGQQPPQYGARGSIDGAVPPRSGRDRDAVLLEYFQTMRTTIEAQRKVMLEYLGRPSDGADDSPRVEPTRQESIPAPAPRPAEPVLPGVGPLEILRKIVSERTGYPESMLDPDLDLEADLGIDSIKRVEILGALAERLGLRSDQDEANGRVVEELMVLRTLRTIVEKLEGRVPEAATGTEAPPPPGERPVPDDVRRYVLSLVHAPAPRGDAPGAGRTIVVADDGHGIAERLARMLEADGATVRVRRAGEAVTDLPETLDAFVYLPTVVPSTDTHPVKDLFELTRSPGIRRVPRILAATGMGGRFGRHPNGHRPATAGGVSGLLKSIAKERGDLRVRVVDLDPAEDPDRLAAYLREELLTEGGPIEVGYANGVRQSPAVVAVPHDRTGGNGRLHLGTESVVLCIGGARGITARIAVALATRFRGHFELVGRSAESPEEDPALAAVAHDLPSLRRALIERTPGATPARIEAECARIKTAVERRATIAAIQGAGATVRYSGLDVRDSGGFEAFFDDIYSRRARIDLVIYAAGIIEDKLLHQKTRESFDRVFDTKVSGALTLARKIREDVGAVVFFSSIAGPFGSRGQADYAAANDVLDKLAWSLRERLASRVVSIDWGPWADGGMVSPELEREYARRGIGLIAPEKGVEALLDELSYGSTSDVQVILSNADPARL